MTGRQAVWMANQPYKNGRGKRAAYDMEVLIAVTSRGNHLPHFLYDWGTVIMGLNTLRDEPTERAPFKMKVEGVSKTKAATQ